MCLLCEDEKAYKAYMDYLDAMERQGKSADPNQAMDAAATTMMVSGKDLADIVTPDCKKVGTREMGEAVLAAL